MAKTKDQKKQEVEKLSDSLAKMKALVFVNYDKLKANEINKLRSILRENKVEYIVAKKTLLKMALKKAKIPADIDDFRGGLGIAFGYDDEIMPAKLLYDFSKEYGNLVLTGGVFENEFIDKARVLALAELPSHQELLIKTVYLLKSPVTGLVNVLKGNLNNLVYALKAISEKSNK